MPTLLKKQVGVKLRFDGFEVDLQAREVRKKGRAIRLAEKPFQLLAKLEHRQTLVTREELRSVLWSGGTFVNFEQSLNAAVKNLRKALGDSAVDPQFIETIPRRGYRFIAPVVELHQMPSSSTGSGGPVRIVVLPFSRLEGARQDHFAQGLTDEVTSQLASLHSSRLQIVAGGSGMKCRSRRQIEHIGKELGVDYLLTGTVRREGTRVRVSAGLIEARERVYAWADMYEQELRNILLAQWQIASNIAAALALRFAPGSLGPAPEEVGRSTTTCPAEVELPAANHSAKVTAKVN